MKNKKDEPLRKDLVLFNLIALTYLVAIVIMLGSSSNVNLQSFIMASCMSAGMIVAYNLGLLQGLVAAMLFVFLYGTYLIYGSLVSGQYAEIKTEAVVWLFLIPLITFVTGRFRLTTELVYARLQKYSSMERLITVDQLTEMLNAQGFFQKLDEEVSRARRFQQPLSLLLIVVHNSGEMSRIYGLDGISEIWKVIAARINESTRNVDIKGMVEENCIAVILPGTNQEGAEVVQKKIYQALERISVDIKGQKRVIKLKTSIGKAAYAAEEDGLSFYDKAKEDSRFAVG